MSNKIDNDQRKEGSVGLYIHWPFCLSKCPYCDFNVHVRAAVDHDAWAAAYVGALSYYAGMVPDRRVESIYFGGGTPSLMSPATVESIIATVRDLWPCADDLDVTLEANPTSVERDRFRDFAAAGVNRLSLGVQALNDADLAFLGRKHSAAEAINALEVAKSAFDRVSFDLIYARPGQSLQDWEGELRRAAALAGGHLSLYQLTIERSTPFYYDHAQGKFHIPDDDLAADFYTLTQDVLDQAGLPAYEVSNHAAAGSESRHNLIYWHYRDYIGIGPGAHGRLTLDGQKHAMRDHHAPEIWLDRVAAQGHGAHPYDVLSEKDQVFEAVMMGLRLRSGMIITPEMRRYLNAAHMKV
ncbi:MAG: radical SAM family heme chaperone HemW, partial [Bdellovibrionales bacterium]